jgi:hypothetical protein
MIISGADTDRPVGGNEALVTMTQLRFEREPEIVFYLARHCSMLGDASETGRMLQRARAEGLTSSYTLERDEAAGLRRQADFQREVNEAKLTERAARRELEAPAS